MQIINQLIYDNGKKKCYRQDYEKYDKTFFFFFFKELFIKSRD